jgi:hypothetical protein
LSKKSKQAEDGVKHLARRQTKTGAWKGFPFYHTLHALSRSSHELAEKQVKKATINKEEVEGHLVIPSNEHPSYFPYRPRLILWAIGMAILTLRKINKNRHYKSGLEVKISRRSVKVMILVTNATLRSNFCLENCLASLPEACQYLGMYPERAGHENPQTAIAGSQEVERSFGAAQWAAGSGTKPNNNGKCQGST